jgi:uncharacterized protein YbjT (DUF2867 family)
MDQARKGPPMEKLVAVTGATGFLGRRLVKALAQQGWTVRILARRDVADPAWAGLEPQLVIGDLANARALAALCDGAETVVHVAGLIKARTARRSTGPMSRALDRSPRRPRRPGRDSSWSPAWPRASRICPITPAANVAEKTQRARFLAVI